MFEKLLKLFKDTGIYGISTIVGRFLNFLLVPFYTNVFTKAEVGVYGNIYAYIAVLNIVFIYGMEAAYMKYASLLEKENRKKIFSTAQIFVTITTIVFAFILFSIKGELNSLMEIPTKYEFLIKYVVFILLFDTLALIPFSHLRLIGSAKTFATIKLINIIINLSLNLILVLSFGFDIEAILIGNLAASAFSLVAVIPVIFKNFFAKIDFQYLKKCLKFGLPYLPASLSATMVQVIDRPILVKLTDEATVGLYTANYKLGIFMLLFVQMFQFAWQPFFLNNAKEENVKEMFSKVLTLFLLFSSVIWVLLTLFLNDIVTFELFDGKYILGKDFHEGLYIVPIVLFAYIFHGIYVNMQAGIYIEEKTKYMPLITGAGALINIAVNLVLIPIYGILGAAFATLASYLTMSGLIFVVTNKFYKINYEYSKIIKIILMMIFIGLVHYKMDIYSSYNFIYKIVILATFFVGIFALKIISLKELKSFKNQVLEKMKVRK